MPAPRTSIPWWLNESLDVVQRCRCFASEWDLLTEGQRERFMREVRAALAVYIIRNPISIDGISVAELMRRERKGLRLAACIAAREIFGRML